MGRTSWGSVFFWRGSVVFERYRWLAGGGGGKEGGRCLDWRWEGQKVTRPGLENSQVSGFRGRGVARGERSKVFRLFKHAC